MDFIDIINIGLFCIMVVHISIAMHKHKKHPEYSAPASVELINVIYYIIPFLAVNIFGYFYRKGLAKESTD